VIAEAAAAFDDARTMRQFDSAFMNRALFWAERGRGRTSPNPMVGAVVVSSGGVVVGQGAHLAAGTPHAEVHALDEAGSRARGSTLYCTLEPCCHVGRTGPCVERIVAAGICRVVVATEDPNPRVAGKGLAYLRQHEIAVDVGVGDDLAQRQNGPFFTWMRHRRPFVIAKAAVSADGFVGRADARVKLTGAAADTWFQRQRAEVDAIAVGSSTVLVDDPLLTVRDIFRFRPLTRVLFDWRGRIPDSARVLKTLDHGPIIMIVSEPHTAAERQRLDRLASVGVSIETFDRQSVREALARLGVRGVLSLLVEGGPALHGALADARLIDRVQRVVTPHVLHSGVRAAPAIMSPAGSAHSTRLGSDVLIEVDVHRAG
jgi:diaminohydroxyphosphoribosylaminopyrimidine deaminase/5-amino-6-(5-phosphoribosylamino)uracil reductase